MRIAITITYLIGIALLSSCYNKQSNIDSKYLVYKGTIDCKEQIDDIISPLLLSVLDDLILLYDSIDNNTNIINLDFKKKGDDCFLKIYDLPDYYSNILKGYVHYKNWIIILYNSDYKLGSEYFIYNYECCDGLLDTTKLVKSKPSDKYRDAYTKGPERLYDPIGRVYKIHSKDSLELVFEGSL